MFQKSLMILCGSADNLSDIAITGRYVESMRDLGLIWRGSTNQRLESPTGE